MMKRIALALVVLSVLAACGDDEGAASTTASTTTVAPDGGRVAAAGPFSVSEALENGVTAPQRVVGYLFAYRDGTMVLADTILESFPPQPGGAQVPVVGFSIEGMTGIVTAPADGTLAAWSETPVEVLGTVADGILTYFDMPNA